MIEAREIVEGFNTANSRQHWAAMAVVKDGTDYVYFKSNIALARIQLNTETMVWGVAFRKASSNFGDFCTAICRSLMTILSTLEAGGLPFAAPHSLDGMEIVIRHKGVGNMVAVRWPGEDGLVLALQEIANAGAAPFVDPTEALLTE